MRRDDASSRLDIGLGKMRLHDCNHLTQLQNRQGRRSIHNRAPLQTRVPRHNPGGQTPERWWLRGGRGRGATRQDAQDSRRRKTTAARPTETCAKLTGSATPSSQIFSQGGFIRLKRCCGSALCSCWLCSGALAFLLGRLRDGALPRAGVERTDGLIQTFVMESWHPSREGCVLARDLSKARTGWDGGLGCGGLASSILRAIRHSTPLMALLAADGCCLGLLLKDSAQPKRYGDAKQLHGQGRVLKRGNREAYLVTCEPQKVSRPCNS